MRPARKELADMKDNVCFVMQKTQTLVNGADPEKSGISVEAD